MATPGNNSGDFEELDNEVNSMMEKSQNRSANGHQFLIFAKGVEKRAMAETLEITLKQAISKELSSPATSVIKLSGLKIVLGPTNHASIQTNTLANLV